MNQRYQRACEIVGCRNKNPTDLEFIQTATDWMLERDSSGEELAEALTEAVLAVEDTDAH